MLKRPRKLLPLLPSALHKTQAKFPIPKHNYYISLVNWVIQKSVDRGSDEKNKSACTKYPLSLKKPFCSLKQSIPRPPISAIPINKYIPAKRICRYLAARRDNSGSCFNSRRSCSENPHIKARGTWQRNRSSIQRWRCNPTNWGFPEPQDCEHSVSSALHVKGYNMILRCYSLKYCSSSYRCGHSCKCGGWISSNDNPNYLLTVSSPDDQGIIRLPTTKTVAVLPSVLIAFRRYETSPLMAPKINCSREQGVLNTWPLLPTHISN